MLLQSMGRLWLMLTGWRADGALPPGVHKVVFIAAPHTSNWDLPHMLAVAWVLGLRPRWMGKHTLFRGPFGAVMRGLGGVPVDRRAPNGMVGQMAEALAEQTRFALMVPPEATRSRAEYWKSGFYRIAEAAGVPIAMGYLDYGSKCGGIGPLLQPTGDLTADMERLSEFYQTITPKHPDQFGPVRFRP